ncbi:Ethylene-responsive transcription factor ERF017, partial [Mucuna pruriens]
MVKPTMDSPCNNIESSCDSSSKMYKGVRKRKWGKWVSEIRLPNSRERIWLGSYDTQEKAARAFDAALYCLRGKTATFNFPDTPHNLETNVVVLPRQSLSPQQIQEVAANFANIHPPTDTASQEQEPSSNSPSESKSNNTLDTVQVDQGDLFDPTDWTFYNTFDDDFNDLYFGPATTTLYIKSTVHHAINIMESGPHWNPLK